REHRLESWSLASIGAHCLDADAEDVTLLGEERHRLRMKAGSVSPVCGNVEKLARALAVRPIRADQYPGVLRNTAEALFPRLHRFARNQEVGIVLGLPRDIDDARWPDEAVDRNVVRSIIRMVLAGNPVNRRIEVRAGVLAASDIVPVPGRTAGVVA